jgi:hypothetical protein
MRGRWGNSKSHVPRCGVGQRNLVCYLPVMTKDVSNQTENELQGGAFIATAEELLAVDTAIAAIDAGEIATDAEVKAAFAKFRPA